MAAHYRFALYREPHLMTPATVFIDADNTLWDTDRRFADAQLALLDQIETALGKQRRSRDRLAFVRAVDQALAERHQDGLRYPPRLLARALAEALGGFGAERAARRALLKVPSTALSSDLVINAEHAFFVSLGTLPEVRPGVVDGLAALKQGGHRLFVITEGSEAKAKQTLAALGLEPYFERLIEGRKRPDLYRRILRLAGMPPRAFMIGDQLDRDIAPAASAGLSTIYFPGGFKPKWSPAEESVRPDYRIGSFSEVATIVDALSAPTPAKALN